ncbi:MAG: peptidase C11 [Lachnospiraceae bacterium]|nr:peptidase C11 [Lachnospiraceae bacterium]
MANGSSGRQKHITEGGKGVHIQGPGLGTGPVGSGSNFGKTSSSGSSSGSGSTSRAPVRGGLSLGGILIVGVIILFTMFMGGGNSDESSYVENEPAQQQQQQQTTSSGAGSLLSALMGGGLSFEPSQTISDWTDPSYRTGVLDTSVKNGARAKRTVIKNDGTDKNVILIYLCGTDLESKSGMASRDLQEMVNASLNDNVAIYVYTGGCKNWKTSSISNSVNQIYRVVQGGITCMDPDRGKASMVEPNTLVDFLTWARQNTSGNRYDLIFWDHGGGSVSGYGYDEKNPRAGSMDLQGIGKALKSGGITFDFIGFDACLMATVETALVVSDYADYMIASEETEPGVGWYYTDWLTALSKNPGMPTVEIGKLIADTFTSACASSAPGQKTTLSVTDLAELTLVVPDALGSFARDTSGMIREGEFKAVSDARSGAREFAAQCKIDQVDLVHLASNLGTDEGKNLAEAIKGCVKYNMTSSSMTNSYGLSMYFPMKRASQVDSMVDTAEGIGMSGDYTAMIRDAASMNVYGQVATGGSGDASASLFGSGSAGSMDSSIDAIATLLDAFLASDRSSFSGLSSSNTEFLADGVDVDTAARFIASNNFPADKLVWKTDSEGQSVITLDQDAWKLVKELALNMFYDTGTGYVDLGIDNVYDIDENGNLIAPYDRTWVSINSQPVAYYYMDTSGENEDSIITGYVPAFLNGERVNLIISFGGDNPYGAVVGVNYDYKDTSVDVTAKNLTELNPGDILTFVCDFYTYDGVYSDTFQIGDALTVPADGMSGLEISNTDVGDGKVRMLYRFTDIYGGNHWSEAIEM